MKVLLSSLIHLKFFFLTFVLVFVLLTITIPSFQYYKGSSSSSTAAVVGFVKAFTILSTTRTSIIIGRYNNIAPTTQRLVSTVMASSSSSASVVDTTTSCPANIINNTNNPLLQVHGLPKFQSMVRINTSSNNKVEKDEEEDGIVSFLTPAIDESLQTLDIEWKALEDKLSSATTTTTYDDVVPVLERIQYPISYIWGIAGHLNGVRNSDGLRTVYETNQPKVVRVMSKFQQSTPLYKALESIPTTNLNDSQRRAIELSLRSMKLGGVGLTDEISKKRFNDIKEKLATLSNTFSNNVLDATKAFSLIITDKNQLSNVPQSALDLWSGSYKAYMMKQQQQTTKEGSGATEEKDETTTTTTATDGPWRITLDAPSYMAVMQHVPDRSIREQVYRAHITRASEIGSTSSNSSSSSTESGDDKNNVPLVYEILQLKQEMATMLGYKNYAEMSLASKMAPSISSITDLANLIAKTALPAAQRELDEITKYAMEHSDSGLDSSNSNETKLQPWDISYWSERLKESKFELTEEETRPYFALPAVLNGMFALVERIFNIRVEEAPVGEVEVWHSDVQYFKVYDASTNEQIAGFFLDPYSRPENKRGGAWMDVCIGKSDAVQQMIPVAYLTCNGSPPIIEKNQPSLMTFREVETLFHEFGHGLQHMLTTVTVGDVAGINGVEWDAVELPSQFMENWCYDRPTIYGFAKHWETQEPIPDEMFEKLKAQKTYNAGMMACRQLLFGQLDLELHANYDPTKQDTESIFDVHRRMAQIYTPYNLPLPEDRFLCSFSHIFAGGYAAGYYSYKWAEVMSSDAFGAFEEVGLDNEEQVKEVGMKFRNTVLSLGGSVDPMTVFRTFRGREPDPEALLRHNGLLATSATA